MKIPPKYAGLSQRQNNAFQVAVNVETPSPPIHGYAQKIVVVVTIAAQIKTINAKVKILPMHAGLQIQKNAFQVAVNATKKEVNGYARGIVAAVAIVD